MTKSDHLLGHWLNIKNQLSSDQINWGPDRCPYVFFEIRLKSATFDQHKCWRANSVLAVKTIALQVRLQIMGHWKGCIDHAGRLTPFCFDKIVAVNRAHDFISVYGPLCVGGRPSSSLARKQSAGKVWLLSVMNVSGLNHQDGSWDLKQ